MSVCVCECGMVVGENAAFLGGLVTLCCFFPLPSKTHLFLLVLILRLLHRLGLLRLDGGGAAAVRLVRVQGGAILLWVCGKKGGKVSAVSRSTCQPLSLAHHPPLQDNSPPSPSCTLRRLRRHRPGGRRHRRCRGLRRGCGVCWKEGKVVGRKRQRGLAVVSLSAGRKERQAPSCPSLPHSSPSSVTATPRWGRQGKERWPEKAGRQEREADACGATPACACALSPLAGELGAPSAPKAASTLPARSPMSCGGPHAAVRGVGGRRGGEGGRQPPGAVPLLPPPPRKQRRRGVAQLCALRPKIQPPTRPVHSPHEDVHGLLLGAAALWGGREEREEGRGCQHNAPNAHKPPASHRPPRRAVLFPSLPNPPRRVDHHSRHRPGTSPTP